MNNRQRQYEPWVSVETWNLQMRAFTNCLIPGGALSTGIVCVALAYANVSIKPFIHSPGIYYAITDINGMAALIAYALMKVFAWQGDQLTDSVDETWGHCIIEKPGKGVHHILTANGWVERSEYYRTLQDAQEDTTHE